MVAARSQETASGLAADRVLVHGVTGSGKSTAALRKPDDPLTRYGSSHGRRP